MKEILTKELHGSKVNSILLRDYCGNPHWIREGDKLPMTKPHEEQDEVSEMWIDATFHGDCDLMYVAMQLDSGNKQMFNLKTVEHFELSN